MADRSNAGERILGARKTTRGQKDALENIVSHGLHDGAQCFVIEEQANYRYVATSELPSDDKYIVSPVGNRGRWIRESGLVGFALLEGGIFQDVASDQLVVCSEYKKTKLVQFELGSDGSVAYIGTVPRVAALSAQVEEVRLGGIEQAPVYLRHDNEARLLAGGFVAGGQLAGNTSRCSLATVAMLLPGDRISLRIRSAGARGTGALRVVLT